ncbi:FxSxx-COOH cyclophane-containing RiPP peptide [Thermopolyspora sp. NPDC052614]|uniref:FxSxx-COOH cyclophane-containing RiPP peptide n=1 Tax=Thermopolyspora sp. NPDC052614 TaxID=3155682 RepID=UPI003433FBEC
MEPGEEAGATGLPTSDTLVSDLVDLTRIDLDAVAACPESVLAVALRRIRRELTEGPDAFSNDYEEAIGQDSDGDG